VKHKGSKYVEKVTGVEGQPPKSRQQKLTKKKGTNPKEEKKRFEGHSHEGDSKKKKKIG